MSKSTRLLLLVGMLLAIFAASPLTSQETAWPSITVQAASEAQPPDAQIDVDINEGQGGAWYTSPLWIAIGVIALLLIVILVAMASRGGGTTVVKG